ncbi:MAG: serine protease [Saprospiraceae bacterium]|jgi:serine protease
MKPHSFCFFGTKRKRNTSLLHRLIVSFIQNHFHTTLPNNMKIIIYTLLLCLLGFGSSLTAQQLTHAQGEILIKTEKDGVLRNAIQDLVTIDGVSTKLHLKKVVVKNLDMYLLAFDFAAINENVMLQKLARHNDILTAQFNHLIDLRIEPNDAQFDQQWQYINTGQDGGTVGADIDMDLAWDITTGGVTANGDTIVVAALDDGIDLNHSDFEDNRWRNWAEIPGNGIDDDNNGYVDDYEGWNSTNDTDDIAGGGHGTPVAGIMGAKGNNEIGVSGVSWNVKVMIIKNNFQTSEAGVLAAYGYALTQRQRYNESNGIEGAFVVSTNASWGINNGQPADAPLWCGFYDTLGEQGILNCGATANANFNIDETGDLPTACPSDYMISVTNMNRDDNKVTSAGYGLETIDLGAFGADTWTTAQGGGYAGFGGTSGASPHVAGTIGLMYSAPCSNIATLALSDPAAAALAVRSYLFDGVDPNASLEGITVTGGRLNVRNALDLLLEDCGPCPPPSTLTAINITVDAADLTWVSNENSTLDTLQYRAVGVADWTDVPAAVSPISLTDLTACTDYEFRVKGSCPEEDSGYSSPKVFRTDGCCTIPEGIIVSEATETSFIVNWEPLTAAQTYNVRWRQTGTTDWTEFNGAVNPSIAIADLTSCAQYEVQVATVCATETTEYSASATIITGGCNPCDEYAPYCERPAGNVVDEWIESISIAGNEIISGENGGEFASLEDPIVIDASQPLEMVMTPAYSGTQYAEFFTVWIDINHDLIFSDDELFYTSSASTMTAETANITLPLTVIDGVTRLRVRMNYNSPGTDPCSGDPGWFGETEDYCVEIINAGLAPCVEVPNLDSLSTTINSITMSWQYDEAAASFILKYAPTAGGAETEVTVTEPPYVVEGLEFCTEYRFRVQAVCESGLSSAFVEKDVSTSCLSAVETLLNEADNMSLFPNPFTNALHLEMTLNTRVDDLQIEILNTAGQILSTQTQSSLSTGRHLLPINMMDNVTGVYFVRISTENGSTVRRVIRTN